MNLIIGAVVLIIIIAGAAFFIKRKSGASEPGMSSQPDKEQRVAISKEVKEAEKIKEVRETEVNVCSNSEKIEEKVQDTGFTERISRTQNAVKQPNEEETSENRDSEKDVRNRLKEQLYRYINHELQNLFYTYNKDEWNELSILGEIPSSLYEEKEEIIEKLPSLTGALLREYFSCIDFKEEDGRFIGYIKDKEKLKQAFFHFMMPFYPYYYKQLSEGGLRHTALLHPNTLRLFQQLTGKKFRPGYRNRYSTGVRAFEWEKDRYKVYRKDGKLLCDAVFGTDGITEGYGQKKYPDKTHPDWDIVEEGNWEEGTFQSGILRYEYKKIVK